MKKSKKTIVGMFCAKRDYMSNDEYNNSKIEWWDINDGCTPKVYCIFSIFALLFCFIMILLTIVGQK